MSGLGELAPEATLRKILRVQREGNREVRREIEFYNLDAIISVGDDNLVDRDGIWWHHS